MAKCTVTIEDIPGERVRVISDPSAETLLKMKASGDLLSPAHGYLFAMLNKAMEVSNMTAKAVRDSWGVN